MLRLSSEEAQLKQSQVGSGLGVSGLGGKEIQGCRPSTQKAPKKHLQNKTDLHLPPHYTLAQMQDQKQRSCHWVQAGGWRGEIEPEARAQAEEIMGQIPNLHTLKLSVGGR